MRNINLLTLVVCLAGGLYLYKHQWREPPPKQAPAVQISNAPPPTLYKCDAKGGGYVYLQTPCPQGTRAPAQRVVEAQPPQQQIEQAQPTGIDPYTAALAKQADERIARQRKEWEIKEQQAAQLQAAQANAAAATCAGLRQEREGILAAQRRGGSPQWMNYLNDRFHTISDALYRNRC